MQKKIIALAIAAAMAAPAAALAEATVYGVADMSIDLTDDGGDTNSSMGNSDNSRTQISSNQSRLGFKGSEDLGGGLTAVFQMEAGVSMDTGTAGNGGTGTGTGTATGTITATGVPQTLNVTTTNSNSAGQFFSRNTFVGLAGGFGTVILGNHDTPYKMSTRKLDVFADSIADTRGNMGYGVLDARATDVLAYVSPDLSGATIAVAYVGETDNTLYTLVPILSSTDLVGATSLSVNFARDNYTVALGNIGLTAKTAGPTSTKIADVTGTKLGGSYSMDAFSVGLVYEMLSVKTPAFKSETNNIYVGGTYNVSDAGTVKLAYTMIGDSKSGGTTQKDGGSQVAVGYDHEMTKNTTLYALYTSVSNNDVGANGLFGLSAGTNADGSATSPNAMSFGIKHSF